MTQRTYILVFRERSVYDNINFMAFGNALKEGERLFGFDDNVVFLQSSESIETLTKRLRSIGLDNTHFFLADITDANRAGEMVPSFWDILHQKDNLNTAA